MSLISEILAIVRDIHLAITKLINFSDALYITSSFFENIDFINKVVRYLCCLEDDDRRKIADRLNADYTVRKLYLGLLDDYKDEEEIPYQIEEAAALALKGCMNIDARTIRISEVVSISWGDGTKFWEEYSPCELHLKDGSMIKPRTIYDYWIIRILFGRNDSGRVFSNIKFEEE